MSRWRNHPAVLVVSGVTAVSLFGDSLLYSILPLYASDLGIPLVAVGLILSMNRWIRLGTNPLAAQVYDRFGLFLPLLGATVLAVISTFLYSRVWGLTVFLLARALWGLCWSHLRLGSFLVILGTSGASLGLAIGTHHAITRLGAAFTSIVGGFLVDRGGYQWGLTVMTVLSTVGILLVFQLRPLLPKQLHSMQTSEEAGLHKPSRPPELSATLCYLGGFVVSFVSAGVIVSSLSLVLNQRLGDVVDLGFVTIGIASIAGLLFAVRWTSNLVVAPLVGKLVDMQGRASVFRFFTVGMIVALVIFAATAHPVITVIVASLLFITGNSLEVILDTAIGDTTYQGGTASKNVSRYASFYDLGAAGGPVVAYVLADSIGFSSAFYVGAALLLTLYVLDRLQVFPVREEEAA